VEAIDMSSLHRAATWLIVAAVLPPGCRSSEDDGAGRWQVVTEERMSSAQTEQRDEALAARGAMFAALKGRLVEVMGSEGPAAAIEVCAREAPGIATRIAETHDVAIGRTAFRLRNPDNTPPAWAAPLVERRVPEPTYLSRAGELAALLPIRLQPECLVCHGPTESIPPDVGDALAELYPQDAATGFEAGELRGWFWIEVPAREGS
jgi:hypothetical protein